MPEELVTVCIPAYNASKYIKETVCSIMKQTYRNIVITIQDNASTDNTKEIIRDLALADSRIILYENAENIGYTMNIRTLVLKAKSKIVCVFHADDVYEPMIIEKEIAAITATNCDAVFTRYVEIGPSGEKIREYPVAPRFGRGEELYKGYFVDYFEVILRRGNPFCCPSFMTTRATFLELGGFNDDFPSNEDLDLWLRYLSNGKCLVIINDYLVKYRRTPSQGSAFWSQQDDIPVFFDVIDKYILPDCRVNTDLLDSYKKMKARGYLFAYSNAWKKGRIRKARVYLDKSRREHNYSIISDGIWFIFQRAPIIYVYARQFIKEIRRFRLSSGAKIRDPINRSQDSLRQLEGVNRCDIQKDSRRRS